MVLSSVNSRRWVDSAVAMMKRSAGLRWRSSKLAALAAIKPVRGTHEISDPARAACSHVDRGGGSTSRPRLAN